MKLKPTHLNIPSVDKVKLRGGYYTPPALADWLAKWAIRSASDMVLEPSCGDGQFIRASADVLRNQGREKNSDRQITAIELIPGEAEKARRIAPEATQVINADFFEWLSANNSPQFDVVLGNPPFIRYQNFPEPARTRAVSFLQSQGFRPNKLTNIWVPFVVGAVHVLKTGGRIALVIPAELLQVSYAAQLREYLTSRLERLTIVTCNEMFFDRVEQEVLLLIGDGKTEQADNVCQVRLVETHDVQGLLNTAVESVISSAEAKIVHHISEKWLKYFLSSAEIDLMRALRSHPKIGMLSDHASVDVGVVTGKNEFFVLSQAQVETFELEPYVVPLVARSAHLCGALITKAEHLALANDNRRVFLLHLSGKQPALFSKKLRNLISQGETEKYNLGYKCSIRSPWYNVPSVWEPDCFLFRQIYDFPRAVVNHAGATSTDTIHRMRCNVQCRHKMATKR